jgi:hypothetical protein
VAAAPERCDDIKGLASDLVRRVDSQIDLFSNSVSEDYFANVEWPDLIESVAEEELPVFRAALPPSSRTDPWEAIMDRAFVHSSLAAEPRARRGGGNAEPRARRDGANREEISRNNASTLASVHFSLYAEPRARRDGVNREEISRNKKLAAMLIDHIDGILNYWRTKVRFGVVEAINGNIRMLINRGRGYKNMHSLLLKAKRMAATNTEYALFRKSGKPRRMPLFTNCCAEPCLQMAMWSAARHVDG